MNEQEIDLLDELYFVQSYEEVNSALDWEDADLQKQLFSLFQKDYIRILVDHDKEFQQSTDEANLIPWKELFFVASKKGLLEHNGF